MKLPVIHPWSSAVSYPLQQQHLPKITIVTPVLNCAAHIAETLRSVLQQRYPKLEYIVVDGGSTDGTLEIIREYETRDDFCQRISLVISELDQGMYDAISKGFEHASGDILCYLNADDLLECDGLTSVGEYFSKHPETQVIYHEDIVLIDGWKYPNVRQPEGVNILDLLDGHIFFQDGVFWRRTAYEAVGGMRRDLKLAGDFDLWLRLSAHFHFVRRPGHVSCFRMRPNQLSSQADSYRREMRISISDFLEKAPPGNRALWAVLRPFWLKYRTVQRNLCRERLFFPVDFINLPPPVATVPHGVEETPRSPIDGKPAERLLFTTPDTRFGESGLNYIYLDKRHEVAITHPHITSEKLDALYRKHYSFPPAELKPPTAPSPYRQFGGKKIWEKALLKLPVGGLARRLFPTAWSDNTLRELISVLNKSEVDTSKPLRFLDIGCFEGHLLDKIRDETVWITSGLEPNSVAVEKARGKGHQVWCEHAENSDLLLRQEHRFDVIYVGQGIEHMEDPVSVLKRLNRLLVPGGMLVVSTPNLDSREIDWFGPTWAHWHPPYHRYIFSKKGLHALAQRAGLFPVHVQTFSNPYWTCMSLTLNSMGLGGSVSLAINFSPAVAKTAQKINFWKEVLWNRLGKGDYCFFTMRAQSE